ncbi:response regulator [Sphingobacterium corticis]|uniref:Response regulator n=1 Tax=Sphingobacterium corticis TaxID=1812823 RepID=A0ABW5NJM9_9SPHI
MIIEKIKVIVIDDHPLVLNGFEHILRDAESIELLATFSNAKLAISFLEQQHVDVILLDINMPEMDGFEAIQYVQKKFPMVHVVAISNLKEASVATRMLHYGAKGYLLKNVSAEELVDAVEQVCEGKQIVSLEMRDMLKTTDYEVPFVTRRESEVLALLASGLTTADIAEKIFISPLTVESHRRNLLQKFKVNNVASLIHRATEMKFI